MGLNVFARVFIRIPFDIYYYMSYVNDEKTPWYRSDNYLNSFIHNSSTILTNLLCRVAIMVNIIRWVILYLSLKH